MEFRSAEPVLQRDLQSSMNECNTSMDMNIWSVESTLRIGVRRLGLVEWIERHMYARHPRVRPSQAPTAHFADDFFPIVSYRGHKRRWHRGRWHTWHMPRLIWPFLVSQDSQAVFGFPRLPSYLFAPNYQPIPKKVALPGYQLPNWFQHRANIPK